MTTRQHRYGSTFARIKALADGIDDPIALMATVTCELHTTFAGFDWTGFYRKTGPRTLTVGPYQGGHGCLTIDFDRGVCGACARTRQTQLVDDVGAVADHIACSSTTRSEIVVPVVGPADELIAVLDIDSDTRAAFDAVDRDHLEELCDWLGTRCAAQGG